MESIKDLLLNRNIEEPSEVSALKRFIKAEFDIEPKIVVQEKLITVHMPNSAYASMLRMRYYEVKTRCQLTRKLYVKISS